MFTNKDFKNSAAGYIYLGLYWERPNNGELGWA